MTAPQIRRHYNKAPIVEAIIDIQVGGGNAISIDDVTSLADSLKGQFPTRLPLHHLQMGFAVAPGGRPEFSNQEETLGFRLDRTGRVLQLRTNGCTYSHLAPYSDWATFSSEAEGYWNLYRHALNPKQAVRVAVRIINRVPLPAGDFQLDSCLNLYPTIPASLPTEVQSFALQLQIPMKHIDDASIAILQVYGAPPVPNQHSIMLDIDFIIQKPISLDDVFKNLNKLGDAKDDIFEACITDAVRKLIS
jgi:uncharacterized protein (TIGR04255 family)